MSVSVSEGMVIGDRYRLSEFLDEGGISKVWLGQDEQTGEKVVIKIPNYDSNNDPRLIQQSIRQEMEVLEDIRDFGGHPNVMELIDSMDVDGQPVMVVEFITGEDMLSAVKRRNGFTNAEDARRVGIDLCKAMSYLHEHEIIYRDLKPDNVILEEDLTPKLIDFNTARGFKPDPGEGESRAGTIIPNPTYKPPELNNDPEIVGYRQGPWSDVYSLGKVLMFMFSASAAKGDGVDPRDFPGMRSVPPYFAEIIKRATQAHKDDRYRNATVLARVLEKRVVEPPDIARITHLQDDTAYEIYPGDTVGRETEDGPQPSVLLDDPDNYISAVQVQFDVDEQGNWLIRDRSLNGTWLQRDGEWYRILSERGRERLTQKKDESAEKLKQLPEEVTLETGDRIALVHPNYGVWLEFEDDS